MVSKDGRGPAHHPVQTPSVTVDGVIKESFPYVDYEHGTLTEVFRTEWAGGVFGSDEPINHLYTVFAPSGGTRKEWYFHQDTLDRFIVLQGSLDVGLYDAREHSATFGKFEVVSLEGLGSGNPSGLRIPPGVWHSLSWASPSGFFLNAKTPPFNRETIDKYRVPPEEWPEIISWNEDSSG